MFKSTEQQASTISKFILADSHDRSIVISKEVALEFAVTYIKYKQLIKILEDYEAGKRVDWSEFLKK